MHCMVAGNIKNHFIPFNFMIMIMLASFLLLFPLLFLFFNIFLFKLRKSHTKPHYKLPPGPWKLPFIGNLHQMIGLLSPQQTINNLAKKYGPIMHLQVGEIPTVIISSKDIAQMAFTVHDLVIANRPENVAMEVVAYKNYGIAFSPYGNYWRQIRRITNTYLLSIERVNSYQSIRQEEVAKLIGSISLSPKGHAINISKMVSIMINSIISKAAFGEIIKDQNEFLALVKEQMGLGQWLLLPAIFPSFGFLQTFGGVRSALLNMQRRMNIVLANMYATERVNEESLFDVLVRLMDSSDLGFKFTTDNINAIILDIFVAASENPSSAIDWAMAEMLRNPKIMDKAQNEIRQAFTKDGKIEETEIEKLHYLKSIIKETLRLHPLIPFIPRETREDWEINGYVIPNKTKVIINTWAICRDPKVWVDPERFWPERYLDLPKDYNGTFYEHLPFGAGKRMCPGRTYAMMSIELALAHLLYHFDWKLPNGMKPEELDMTETFAVVSGRKNELYVFPTPYITNV